MYILSVRLYSIYYITFKLVMVKVSIVYVIYVFLMWKVNEVLCNTICSYIIELTAAVDYFSVRAEWEWDVSEMWCNENGMCV